MSDCLLGVHDGLKVATPGDRLVNGAGVFRDEGASQRSAACLPTRTAVNQKLSAYLRWAIENKLATAGGSTSAVQCNWDHESGRWVGFPHGASGRYLVALKIGPTAELEYMLQEPGVVGSSPIGATCNHVAP